MSGNRLNPFKVVLKSHPGCLHGIENCHCLSINLTIFWMIEERGEHWLFWQCSTTGQLQSTHTFIHMLLLHLQKTFLLQRETDTECQVLLRRLRQFGDNRLRNMNKKKQKAGNSMMEQAVVLLFWIKTIVSEQPIWPNSS